MYKKLVLPKTEDEITKHWKHTDKVYTSVVCTTYNQESYIRDAIDSFLAQVTEYRFEVIIHDDASTDSTKEILTGYQHRFPSIIRLILQDDNQFSINCNMPFKHAVSIAEGEYIAICEGDDFWIDKYKLAHQHLNMIREPNVHLSYHSSLILDKYGNIKAPTEQPKSSKIIPLEDIIIGGGGAISTNSIMINRMVIENLPSWFFEYASVGDYYLQILGSIKSGALYIPITSSVYRTESIGSWSESNNTRYSADIIMLESKNYEICINEFRKIVCKDSVSKALDLLLSDKFFSFYLIALNRSELDVSNFQIKKAISYSLSVKTLSFFILSNIFNIDLVFYHKFKKLKNHGSKD